MSENKHTPGTTKIVLNNDDYLDIEADSRICSIYLIREDITIEEVKANAARIVKCWNEHDDLVALNKELTEACERSLDYLLARYPKEAEHLHQLKNLIEKANSLNQ